MSFAKSIDDAMSMLKLATVPDDEQDTDEEFQKAVADLEEDIEIEAVEASTDCDVEEFVKADAFMEALATNQDLNTDRLVKAISGNLNATNAVLKFLKGMAERITAIEDRVGIIASTPRLRQAVMTKSEAQNLRSVVAESPKEPKKDMHKGEIAQLLYEASKDGKCDPSDVVKAESSFGGFASMMEVQVQDLVRSLSLGGQQVVRNYLDTVSE